MVDQWHRRAGLRALAAALAFLAGLPAAFAQAPAAAQPQVAWTSSMAYGQTEGVSNITCRWIVRPSIAGKTIRIHLSNLYSPAPETFGAVTVALRTTRAATGPATPVTFGGSRSVTIPAQGEVVSDPIAFKVGLHQDLAISTYYAGVNPVITQDGTTATSYCTTGDGSAGDHTADTSDAPFVASGAVVHWVDAVDVYTAPATGAVVALGDSITNGLFADLDGNDRWVDVLTNRLVSLPDPKSAVNQGISGDTACSNSSNNGAVDRLQRDVLAQAGVSHVIMFVGTNDIANINSSGSTVIGCYQNIVSRVRAAGLKILGATMIPRSFDASHEASRTQVNAWLRTPGNVDGIIDFDTAVRDPANPVAMLPLFDSGDHIHPNPSGHLAMGNSIDLALFGLVARPNLSLQRTTSADSACQAAESADKAANASFAGGLSDKWCSGGAAPWWQVDLGAAYDVNQVVLYNAAAGGESAAFNTRAWHVDTSTDGTSWKTRTRVDANAAADAASNFSPAKARYVRVNVDAPEQGSGGAARIYEIQVFGSAWSHCADAGDTCTVSGARDVRYGAGNAFVTLKVASGSIACTTAAFGSDPAPGTPKHCDSTATWPSCAQDGGTCAFSGTQVVKYGAGDKLAYRVATGSIACSSAAFGGDPAPGKTKTCGNSAQPPADNGWTQCAAENATCAFSGKRSVAYGAAGSFRYLSVDSSVACSNTAFGGDPLPGVGKACYYR